MIRQASRHWDARVVSSDNHEHGVQKRNNQEQERDSDAMKGGPLAAPRSVHRERRQRQPEGQGPRIAQEHASRLHVPHEEAKARSGDDDGESTGSDGSASPKHNSDPQRGNAQDRRAHAIHVVDEVAGVALADQPQARHGHEHHDVNRSRFGVVGHGHERHADRELREQLGVGRQGSHVIDEPHSGETNRSHQGRPNEWIAVQSQQYRRDHDHQPDGDTAGVSYGLVVPLVRGGRETPRSSNRDVGTDEQGGRRGRRAAGG